jgi:hypothetical protein
MLSSRNKANDSRILFRRIVIQFQESISTDAVRNYFSLEIHKRKFCLVFMDRNVTLFRSRKHMEGRRHNSSH